MPLKIKVLAMAIIPLIFVTATITYVNLKQARELAATQIQTFEENLLASKRSELQNYMDLAMTSLSPVLSATWMHELEAQQEVLRILRGLTFGDNGYFFVYDAQGVNLMHPTLPELEGKALYNLRDVAGDYVIRDLLSVAKEGGYHRYMWHKPTDGGAVDKLAFVVTLPRWGWMIGTGLYVDDITADVTKAREEVTHNIHSAFFSVILVAALSIVIIVTVGVAFNLHESRIASRRIRQLAHKSVQFQVNQRRHFARELHDGINQLMVSAKFRMELAMRKLGQAANPAHQEIDKALEILNLAIQEVRRVSHDLRPSLLDDMGLASALNSLLLEYRERTGWVIKTNMQLPDERLPEDIEITLYRTIQEALHNAEKHAEATAVNLRIWEKEGDIYTCVADNGCGFITPVAEECGIGLLNMTDRIELLSGELTIKSEQGSGTTILVRLPLEQYLGREHDRRVVS